MWDRVRSDLRKEGKTLSAIANKSQGEIKDSKYRFPIIKKIGKRHAIPVQKLSIDESVRLFNSLPEKRRSGVLEEIFGVKTDKPILNAYVEGNSSKIYWDEVIRVLVNGKMVAEKLQDKSYRILVNKKPIVRLQASFTNGVGLSAFCERAFLLTKI